MYSPTLFLLSLSLFFQAEKLTTKQLSNLVLTPSQVRALGYDGPVTPAHVACLSLSAAQIAQLDLTKEQRADLSPYQDSVVCLNISSLLFRTVVAHCKLVNRERSQVFPAQSFWL